MPLTRLDYQPADYSSGVASAGAGLATTIDGIQQRYEADRDKRDQAAQASLPADPDIQHALRRIVGGEDPKQVAIEMKVQRHLAGGAPAAGSAPSPQPSAPSRPGPWAGSYGQAPSDLSAMEPYPDQPQPRQQPLPVSQRGPRGPTADMSPLGAAPNTITNADVPTYLKVGGALRQADAAASLNAYRQSELGLQGGRLDATLRGQNLQQGRFDAEKELRDARTELMQAQVSAMPERIAQAWKRVQIAEGQLELGHMNYEQRETGAYMKGAGSSLNTAASADQLVQEMQSAPGLRLPNSDYVARRAKDLFDKIPVLGKAIGQAVQFGADESLTQAQLNFRQRASMVAADFIKEHYGSAVSEGEREMANLILGEKLSYVDTMAGLMALSNASKARSGIYGKAYPGAAQRIGSGISTVGGPVTGQGQYGGFGGPENIGQPQGPAEPPPPGMGNTPPMLDTPRQLRGTIKSSFGGP